MGIISLTVLVVTSVLANKKVPSKNSTVEVLEKDDVFEIREYSPSLVASVELGPGSYESLSRKGFNALAGYIFGGNNTGQKIAMTSPVMMRLGTSNEMYFFMPEGIQLNQLPTPNNKRVELSEIELKKVAVIRFGGWASDAKIEKYKQQLKAILKEKGLKHTSNYFFMGYNAPFDVVNRKNEVGVELL